MISKPIRKLMAMRQTISVNSHRWQQWQHSLRSLKYTLPVACAILLLPGILVAARSPLAAHAANPGAGQICTWHRVTWGETLSAIARRYHTTSGVLARANRIHNENEIFVGQMLCIPASAQASSQSGLSSNGKVRWYAYNALENSSPDQISALLDQEAQHYQVPVSLLRAIAWQESGWHQHIIAHDGGIGTMQIMPYTATALNRAACTHYDPYKLRDNIALGALYLHSLMNGLHGNLTQVISAYNEGGWNVTHRGIFNWSYVHSVQLLMWKLK